jgi:hypothetical protein
MSAPHHSLSNIPPLDAYRDSDESGVRGEIEAYLHCEDLVGNSGQFQVPTFAPDDVSLMRAAQQMAARIRKLEEAEGPITAAGRRIHRVTGSALTYIVQQCSTRVREISEEQYETLGQFRDLITDFVVQRIKQSSSLLLYEQMQGEFWTDTLQEGVFSCVEQLWEVSSISGMVNADSDPGMVVSALNAMATVYTVAWFGKIDMERVDVTAIDFAVNRLTCHTLKQLIKQH